MDDQLFMRRALELARLGANPAAEEPSVSFQFNGAVIVRPDPRGGEIVGEGWRAATDSPAPELQALAMAGDAATGGALYVAMEPLLKDAQLLLDHLRAAGIHQLVFALAQPQDGAGDALDDAGILTRGGICADEARDLAPNGAGAAPTADAPSDRPYVIAAFEASLDGKTATRSGDSRRIAGSEAHRRRLELRQSVDAVIVGANTVIRDDPDFTPPVDVPPGAKAPVRVVLDSTGRTRAEARVFDPELPGLTLLAATERMKPERMAQFQHQGVEVILFDGDAHGRVSPHALLAALHAGGVQRILLEGGSTVIGAFFDAGLVDETWFVLAPRLIGGGIGAIDGAGPDFVAESWRLKNMRVEMIESDLLIRGKVTHAPGDSDDLPGKPEIIGFTDSEPSAASAAVRPRRSLDKLR